MPGFASFIFTTCQIGAESTLKAEIPKNHPELRAAFQRPGWVTFKAQSGSIPEGFHLRSVFARHWGMSFSKAANPGDVSTELSKLLRTLSPLGTVRIQAFARDQFPVNEAPPEYDRWEHSRQLTAFLKTSGNFAQSSFEAPRSGDYVIDICEVDPENWAIGWHRHERERMPWPGSLFSETLPAEAPSRAWLKMEEALAWSHAPVHKGDQFIEIGSAPGGASFALIHRGIHVIGIDPGKMNPILKAHSGQNGNGRYVHLESTVAEIRREDLPANIHWFAVDMNTAPKVTLSSLARLALLSQETMLGALVTLKLNRWEFVEELDTYLSRLRSMGFAEVRFRQLSQNKQELLAYCLTRKGQIRRHA